MDATTLRAVLAELRQVLLPSRFEKAQQARPCPVMPHAASRGPENAAV
jgi:hypothetical protein